jgi:GNAT superfamily N-acetyltransferase
VLVEGIVRPGDPIRVLPPAKGSRAVLHRQLDLYDSVERHAYLTLWTAARRAGIPIDILEDGELAVAATTATDDSSFCRALGLRLLPNLLGRVLEPSLRTGATGWLVADEAPWRDAMPGSTSTLFAGPVSAPGGAPEIVGLTIRRVDASEADRWAEVNAEAFEMSEADAAIWRRLAPHLAEAPGEQLFLAEVDGRPVATSALYLHRRVGLLAAGAVLPASRGRGIQRALIADRIRRAVDARATAGATSRRRVWSGSGIGGCGASTRSRTGRSRSRRPSGRRAERVSPARRRSATSSRRPHRPRPGWTSSRRGWSSHRAWP